MATFNYPAIIDKNTPAVAGEVQVNFDTLLTWILGNLIQKDGSISMTGPLVLAPGAPGAPEQAANKAYVDASNPVGMMSLYAGATPPVGWLLCDGTVYTNTSQPRLAAAIARNFTAAAVPADSFAVPDMRGRMPMGVNASDALGKGSAVAAGSRNSELLSHFHTIPEHGHGSSASSNQVDLAHQHDYSGNTASAGVHGHGLGNFSALAYSNPNGWATVPGGGGTGLDLATWLHDGDHYHSFNGTTGYNRDNVGRYHQHIITVTVNNQPAFNTVANGAGTTLVDKNLPPYVAVNYIIYAGA